MAADQGKEGSVDHFGCDAVLRETVHVRQDYLGRTFWEGDVEVFELDGHPSAQRAYVVRCNRDRTQAYSVLHAGLVESPESAVRAVVVHEARAREV